MKKISKSIKLGGRELTLSTGELAEQADGAVVAKYGDTVLLATISSSEPREEKDYFPLSVDYMERLYAGGRIKGSRWVKRSGRPTDEEILNARVIDRSVRPLFPQGYKKDVQIVIMVLSVDSENNPADIAPIAASAAIAISKHPWHGPVSVLRVGLKDDKFITTPNTGDSKDSQMDLIVSSTKDAIVMIEAGAKQVSEEKILSGIEHAQKESKAVLKLINDLAKEAGVEKQTFEKPETPAEIKQKITKLVGTRISEALKEHGGKKGAFDVLNELRVEAFELVEEEEQIHANAVVENIFKDEVRKTILSGKRVDGRKHDQIRELSSQVGVLPRTHGSGLFKRGSTQALTITTLGAPSEGQLLESALGESEKKYIHHYSMPPYSIGEAGRVGFTSRREIGHGMLAERALVSVLPLENEFPYTIHVVTEIMSSNGSTSMASTCGSTLSLMDAGVPITSPVSGIAMGLVIEGKNVAILSDIMGIEDFNGDMDFKIAGTKTGVTAMQMDVKTLDLTLPILKKAIALSKVGRVTILKSMLEAIDKPRAEVSKLAPKIVSIQIDPEKIGEVIGPGGKMIKSIIAETGADVDVEDDGTVNISGVDAAGVDKAKEWVENLVKVPEPGEVYEGEIKRIEGFGAFVEILPGKDGLVHISDMAEGYVSSPDDLVKLGQKVSVRVKEIDGMGRLNLSMILDPAKQKEKDEQKSQSRGGDRGGQRGGGHQGGRGNDRGRGGFSNDRRGGQRGGGGQRFGNRNDRKGGGNDRRDRGGSSGPHFPASRLVSSDKKRR